MRRSKRRDYSKGVSLKAIVYTQYGPPDVLKLTEVPKPVCKDNEVLVRVHAASVSAGDWHLLRGTPLMVRLYFGLTKPRHKILGADVAGVVEAVGMNVTQFHPGDEVYGDLTDCGFGAYAQFACANERSLAHKPSNLSYEQAAAVPVSAVAALQALRDKGQLQPGEKVLVNGASGGVGTYAVQLAKALEANVTGVGSTAKHGILQSLGVDQIIDYTKQDVTTNGHRYDLILDTAAYRSIADYRRILNPAGRYVMVGGSGARLLQAMGLGPWMSRKGGKQFGGFMVKPNQQDLLFLTKLIEEGKVRPVVDKCFPLSEVPEAIRYVEEGHARGKVVINVRA